MTREDLNRLLPGDLVRHKHCGDAMIVTRRCDDGVIAVRIVEVTNPGEWDQVDRGGRVIS